MLPPKAYELSLFSLGHIHKGFQCKVCRQKMTPVTTALYSGASFLPGEEKRCRLWVCAPASGLLVSSVNAIHRETSESGLTL